jgi:hypothetical protein
MTVFVGYNTAKVAKYAVLSCSTNIGIAMFLQKLRIQFINAF